MKKKLKIQMAGRSDEFQTPKEAIYPLLPYLKKTWIVWECAWGKGSLARHLKNIGFKIVGGGGATSWKLTSLVMLLLRILPTQRKKSS